MSTLRQNVHARAGARGGGGGSGGDDDDETRADENNQTTTIIEIETLAVCIGSSGGVSIARMRASVRSCRHFFYLMSGERDLVSRARARALVVQGNFRLLVVRRQLLSG